MSRLHPFDYVFGAFADARFDEIKRESERAGLALDDRLRFQRFEPARRLLGEIQPAERGELAAAALEAHGTLLYSAYRFWLAGRRSISLTRAAVDPVLVSPPPAGDPVVPNGACYLQLPEQWFWARIGADAAHEPMDGMFLARDGSGGEIVVLAVLGLRADRGGFSQIALAAPPADFRRAAAGARHPPFAPVMDGGDRAGMRSVVSEGELLHVAHLALVAAAR